MTGQFGVILETRDRGRDNLSYIKWLFTYLLLVGDKGGRRATGVAWLDREHNYYVLERVGKLPELTRDTAYAGFLSGADSGITWLGGHTHPSPRRRGAGEGSGYPMRSEEAIGTYEGKIANAESVCRELGFEGVNLACCELALHLAGAAVADGRIDVPMLADKLSLCRGRISAVIASRMDPRTFVVVRGDPPLEVRYYDKLGAVVYGRDSALLDTVLASESDWRRVNADPMSLITFCCSDLSDFSVQPFALA